MIQTKDGDPTKMTTKMMTEQREREQEQQKHDQEQHKQLLQPVTTLPIPHISALVVMVSLFVLCLLALPGTIQALRADVQAFEAGNNDAAATTTTIFTHRVYPQYLSLSGMMGIRIFFGGVCGVCTIYQLLYVSVQLQPPYLRPYSQLRETTLTIRGVKHFYPLTSWSWIVLGVYFWCAAYLAFQGTYDDGHNTTTTTTTTPSSSSPLGVTVFTLILWKIAAPITLLIGVVVKYVLWPEAIKKDGPHHILKQGLCLLQHTGNIMMVLIELLFLGRIPLMGTTPSTTNSNTSTLTHRYQYCIFTLLYGITYVFFSWSTMLHWNPPHSKLGPGCIYFFMDPTIGWRHTVILVGLLVILIVFYGVFSYVEEFANAYDAANSSSSLGDEGTTTTTTKDNAAAASLYHHGAMMITVILITCRFRD